MSTDDVVARLRRENELLDLWEAREARGAAIARAQENADDVWWDGAMEVVRKLAGRCATLHPDDVREAIEADVGSPDDWRRITEVSECTHSSLSVSGGEVRCQVCPAVIVPRKGFDKEACEGGEAEVFLWWCPYCDEAYGKDFEASDCCGEPLPAVKNYSRLRNRLPARHSTSTPDDEGEGR